MPKDRERYRYVDVGLERGSWTLAMFEEDAKKHQMSDQPGKLITLRLTEYYELKKERETVSPGTSSSRDILSVANDRTSLLTSYAQRISKDSIQAQGDDMLELSHHAAENADEAAEYWAGV